MLKSVTTAAKPPSSLTQACRSQRARLWFLALDGTLCSLPPTSTPSLSDAPIEHFPIRSECLLLVSLRRLGDGTRHRCPEAWRWATLVSVDRIRALHAKLAALRERDRKCVLP